MRPAQRLTCARISPSGLCCPGRQAVFPGSSVTSSTGLDTRHGYRGKGPPDTASLSVNSITDVSQRAALDQRRGRRISSVLLAHERRRYWLPIQVARRPGHEQRRSRRSWYSISVRLHRHAHIRAAIQFPVVRRDRASTRSAGVSLPPSAVLIGGKFAVGSPEQLSAWANTCRRQRVSTARAGKGPHAVWVR